MGLSEADRRYTEFGPENPPQVPVRHTQPVRQVGYTGVVQNVSPVALSDAALLTPSIRSSTNGSGSSVGLLGRSSVRIIPIMLVRCVVRLRATADGW